MTPQLYPFSKNRYFAHKRMRSADFVREQEHMEHKLAFLSRWDLGTGVALGLEAQRVDGDSILVSPGFAVDGYDVLWSDPLNGTVMLLEAVCLDVRGRLMLTASADAGAQRAMSQLVRDILNQDCCSMAKSKTIDPAPKDWDLPALRPGPSDYATLRCSRSWAPLLCRCSIKSPGRSTRNFWPSCARRPGSRPSAIPATSPRSTREKPTPPRWPRISWRNGRKWSSTPSAWGIKTNISADR